MKLFEKIKALSRLKKIALTALILFAVYTISGFLIVPPIVKWLLAKNLTEQLHREVTIGKIKMNPYELSVNVSGFLIKDRTGRDRFVSFDELYVNLQAASIYKKGLILREVRIDGPYANIKRSDETTYNFSDLLESGEERETEPPADDSGPFRFSINNIQITNGGADFLDGPKDTAHKVRDLTVTIPLISNFPYLIETFVQPAFGARINDRSVALKGRTKPFSNSLETVIDLNIDDLDITHYLAYVPVRLNFNFLSGMISLNNSIAFTQYAHRPSSLIVSGDVFIKTIETTDTQGRPLIKIPAIHISIAPSALSSGRVHVSKVMVQSPEVHVRRDKAGGINIASIVSPAGTEETGAQTEENDQAEESDEALLIEGDEVRIEGGRVVISDESPAKTVETVLGGIELTGKDISTAEESKGSLELSFAINKKGRFTTNGSLGIHPLTADLKFDLKDIDIVPLQPYFTDKVKILVTGGRFSTGGSLSLGTAGDEEMNVTYKGKTSLTEFASVDKANANDFLKWNSLYLNGISFSLIPLHIVIDEVALADFYSRLIINPDGSINVQDIVKDEEGGSGDLPEADEAAGTETEEKGAGDMIKINTVTLQAGTINFSDRHIKPEYSANLLQVGGRISGLSSEEGTMADVDLRGNLENYAPLEIKGNINPLIEDLYVDLKLDFKDMDLSPLTPYANKYIGYTIQKGKLSLDLQYLIVKKKLDAKNSIYLDQFTLGERVESPDATKLPVKLAISLLKDSSGEISLDLPVSGEIGDPEFRLGGIILKMITNILVKAATSPFGLLGAIVGGGEELSYVEFDYGGFSIREQEKAKLDKLIKALADRPGLSMDIEGFVDTEKDREGLRQYAFDNKLKAQKLKDVVEQGGEAAAVDGMVIGPDEYETYLTKAYKEETFPKPRNALGMAKTLPVAEMEKLILTYIVITDDHLRQLAADRALKVKNYILQSGQIAPERIFLIEPKSLQPGEDEKLRYSRVDFKLR